MTAEQLAYLTDDERAAWEACEAAELPWADMGEPFLGEIRRCYDFALLLTDGDDHPEARRFVSVASYALPLALVEIARLRSELAEARATIANEMGAGEPPGEGWVRSTTSDGALWERGLAGPADDPTDVLLVFPRDNAVAPAWERWTDQTQAGHGEADTVRACMRAADAATKEKP